MHQSTSAIFYKREIEQFFWMNIKGASYLKNLTKTCIYNATLYSANLTQFHICFKRELLLRQAFRLPNLTKSGTELLNTVYVSRIFFQETMFRYRRKNKLGT